MPSCSDRCPGSPLPVAHKVIAQQKQRNKNTDQRIGVPPSNRDVVLDHLSQACVSSGWQVGAHFTDVNLPVEILL